MRYIILLLCCISLQVQAQPKKPVKKKHRHGPYEPAPPPPILVYVEQRAEFNGGMEALTRYIHSQMRYPEQAREAGIAGKVIVQFVIGTDGNVSDISVLRGIGAGCDQEAVRVVRNMPQWYPAKKNGRAVKSYFILPLVFAFREG